MLLRARWVLPITDEAIRDGAVVVRGSRIVDVGPHAVVASRHPGVRERDLGDAILFPGFVDVHAHLELTLLRGLAEDLPFHPWIRRIVQLAKDLLHLDEVVYHALLGAAEMIRGGTTCVADCTATGAPFDALSLSGLRGIVFQEAFGQTPELARAALPVLAARLDALGAMATDRVRPGISPHSPYLACTPMLEACAAMAVERRLPLALHCSESLDERSFLLDGSGPIGDLFRSRGQAVDPPGVLPVQHLDRLGWLDLDVPVQLIHLARAEPAELDLLAAASARPRRAVLGLAACPRSNARLGNGWPDLEAWDARHLSWGLGTDGAPSVGRCDMFAEMRHAWVARRGHSGDATSPTARAVLGRATLEAARSLGLDAQIGSIEQGKQADLAAVSLAASRHVPAYEPHVALLQCDPADVVLTMVAGEVLFDGREILTIDEERVAAACRERAEGVAAGLTGRPGAPPSRPTRRR